MNAMKNPKLNLKRIKNKHKRKIVGALPGAIDNAASDAERDAIVAEEVAAAAAYVPKNPKDAARHAKLREQLAESRANRGGRPKIGLGAAKVNLTMERALLAKVDAYAQENSMTRAAVLARGAELLLNK